MKTIETKTTSGGAQRPATVDSKPEDDYDTEPVYPQILVYNVGRAGVRQIADAPNHDEATLIQGFITALRHIDNKGYVVQGAMYSPDMANIFIETDDEDWADHVDCHE